MRTFAIVVLLAGLAAVHAAADQQTGPATWVAGDATVIKEPSYIAAVRHLLQSTSQGSGTSQTNSTEGGTGSTAAGESAAGTQQASTAVGQSSSTPVSATPAPSPSGAAVASAFSLVPLAALALAGAAMLA